jgi:hypothetical protein
MPVVGAYVASYLATQAFASIVAKFVISTLISFAINAVFAKKPASSNPFSQEAQDRSLTVRQPIAAERVVYGQVLIGGVYDFIHSSSRSSDTWALTTEQEVVPSSLTIRVSNFSQWREAVSVQSRLYDQNDEQYVNTTLTKVAGAPAAGEYSVTSGTYTFNAAQTGALVNITYKYLSGTATTTYLHLVIELAGHEVEEIGSIYFDDQIVTTDADGFGEGRYAGGYVYVGKHLGADDQTADTSLISFCPDKWTANHRLRGKAYIYVRLQRNPELFPNGLPNIRALVKGKKVYDPRTGTTVWSQNVALCVADYLTNTRYGLGHVYASEIDETALIAAANICDENVNLAAGGTEDRYTCNGSFLTSERPVDVLGRLKVAMAGDIVRVGGEWKIYAGAYRAPALALDEDDCRGPLQVKARLSGRELFNGVKGVYVSPENAWQPADFPAVTNATYLAEDQGERAWLDMDLAFTTSFATAQRIAKIELERVRQQISVIMPCKLNAYKAEPPDTIQLSDTVFGWTNKVFELKQAQLVVDRDEGGNPALGVDLLLRETASSVWTWSAEETAVDTAPNTNLPNPFAVAPPGQPAVSEDLYETRDGAGVRAKAIVTWAAASDGQAVRYEFQLRDSSGTLLQQVNDIDAVSRRVEVLDIAPARYQFRARAVNGVGVRSAWSQTEKEIIGLAAAPADVSGFTLQAAGGLAILRWTLHPDLDVRIGGKIVFRHSETTSGAVWQEAFTIGEAAPGNANFAVLPLKAGTYLAKAEDSSGILSATAATISTKQASVLAFSTLTTVQEDTSFGGTHSGSVAIDGLLKLVGAGLFDAIPDFDSVASLDDYGGVGSSGTYTFSAGIDLTTVKRVRVTSKLEGVIVNVNDLIDSRTDSIDDWLDFDGTLGADADAYVEMRETDDDPAGTPTWSAWKRLDADEHECRGLEFRAQIVTNDPAYNVHIDVLRATVAEVV